MFIVNKVNWYVLYLSKWYYFICKNIYLKKKNYWDVLISLKLINGICLFFFLEWNKY